MATPEGKVKAAIKRELAARGPRVWYCMPRGTTYGAAGVPDFLCCVGGHFLAIEAKAAGGKLSALQHMQMDRICAAQGGAITVSPAEVELLGVFLDRMLEQGYEGAS